MVRIMPASRAGDEVGFALLGRALSNGRSPRGKKGGGGSAAAAAAAAVCWVQIRLPGSSYPKERGHKIVRHGSR